MQITVEELDKKLKGDIFKNLEAYDISTVYENIDNSEELKLVVFFNKVFYKEVTVLYTKLIFFVDSDKKHLTRNSFLYLYDINCQYKDVEFIDLDDMKSKIDRIFTKQRFGENIKILSELIKAPATLINKWLNKNEIKNISIYGLNYNPKVKIIPCKYLFFSFNINVNGNTTVELTISKETSDIYTLDFKFMDKNIKVEKRSLNNLIEIIGTTLKNNIS